MENVLLIIPGGGDPFYNDVYFKTYQYIIDYNNIVKKYKEVRVLSMPGHFSFSDDESICWNIDKCQIYLEDYIQNNNIKQFSLLGRSGGCNIIAQYLLNKINPMSQIKEVILINPVTYDTILNRLVNDLEEFKKSSLKNGLRIGNGSYRFKPFEYCISKICELDLTFFAKIIIASGDPISYTGEKNKNRIEYIISENKNVSLYYINSDKHEIDDTNKDEYFNLIFKSI